MKLSGRRVLLTGAAGGLGETTARALAELGAVLILSGRNGERLAELAAALPGEGHEVIVADLGGDGAAEQVVAEAGQVDVFIANAGQPGGAALDELSAKDVSDVIRVNFEVPVQMTRLLIPEMRERGSGQIVLIASMAGKFPLPESTMYSGTKAALRVFGWALRAELARVGIGVTIVTPGFISEVGMFARRGRKAPPGTGTTSPARYARQLVRAIQSNTGEVVIAPAQLRVLAQLALVWPGLIARVFRRAAPSRRSP